MVKPYKNSILFYLTSKYKILVRKIKLKTKQKLVFTQIYARLFN